MWGTQSPARRPTLRPRFIPTHVGNTSVHASPPILGSVHPHACGEHQLALDDGGALRGSSPRMWGTPHLRRSSGKEHRFIPTHVGNTAPCGTGHNRDSVHPHACGEHIMLTCVFVHPAGSSPRMWGTPNYRPVTYQTIRFIPTHVGNTGQFEIIHH